MDILLRLRVLIWMLVLCLWGVMVYQFLGEEEAEERRMQVVANPYKGVPLPAPEPGEILPPSEAGAAFPTPQGPTPGATPRSSLEFLMPEPEDAPEKAPPPQRAPPRRPVRREAPVAGADHPAPAGFVKTATRHFTVYAEGDPASEEFLSVLESLHGNLMLDLAAFSPWASDEKVSVYLFKNQDTYRQVTGRPAWSGGASSVPRRKVYVYESEELPGILAHELCHIYYDGFFLEGKSNPLWLSEGMATLIQVERGLSAPNWLRDNMMLLEQGGGYSLEELAGVAHTAGASDDRVRLWYAQSYSTVRFLLRSRYRSSFYRFSQYLREGRDLTEALYRAYGMPYNRLKALEYAWRYDLNNSSLARLAPADR